MVPQRRISFLPWAAIPLAALAAGIWYAISLFVSEPADAPTANLTKVNPAKATPVNAAPDSSDTPANALAARATSPSEPKSGFIPKRTQDTSGFFQMVDVVKPWPHNATLSQVRQAFQGTAERVIDDVERKLAAGQLAAGDAVGMSLVRVLMFNCEGQPDRAYAALQEVRSRVENNDELARQWLYTIIHLQGVVSMRRGENDNCIMCRGESSCIIPISPAAVHTVPDGSRQAIVHFTEYLEQFPDELEVRWLLNLAHMTLGEHPQGVEARYRLSLDKFNNSEFDIGKFRDIGDRVGVNRFNQSGGAIMEDFDNDGLLDVIVTSIDPSAVMGLYRNTGDGKFVECTAGAGLSDQLGGLNCGQTDYNNDGMLDVFVPRGAWFNSPVRPSLLSNNGDGTFSDVTGESGLIEPLNSNSAAWADYDNDGCLDLFIACERQPNRLYHNEGNGTFFEVARRARVQQDAKAFCKAGVWLDYDNDDFPDLFLNNLEGVGRLFRNDGRGAFSDVSEAQGIDGPKEGFPCWAWDYDNDGWLDIFATSYFRNVRAVVQGMLGEPSGFSSNRLFHNRQGQGFADETQAAGLNLVLATMGCNYADFDNDGFLDMYLGTGAPGYEFLVPNRMFKNVAGERFADITGKSGTGHLQKGHGVACGDWDRDGNVDVFIQLGGPATGDKFHNVLFQNPGRSTGPANRWLTLKLIGRRTNRAALGARIKIVTAGSPSLTIHRHISPGSSFGANPLEQTIGLGQADRIAELEIHWPAGGTTQVVRDVDVNQSLEVIEGADGYRRFAATPVGWPE